MWDRSGITFIRNDSGGAYPKLEPILGQLARLGMIGRGVCRGAIGSLIVRFTVVTTCEYKACYAAGTCACVEELENT